MASINLAKGYLHQFYMLFLARMVLGAGMQLVCMIVQYGNKRTIFSMGNPFSCFSINVLQPELTYLNTWHLGGGFCILNIKGLVWKVQLSSSQ